MIKNKIAVYAGLLKVMGNERRLEILYQLYEKECNVGELEKKVKLSQSALSQHLAVLRKEGVVKTRRVAQTIYYSIKNSKVEAILNLLNSF